MDDKRKRVSKVKTESLLTMFKNETEAFLFLDIFSAHELAVEQCSAEDLSNLSGSPSLHFPGAASGPGYRKALKRRYTQYLHEPMAAVVRKLVLGLVGPKIPFETPSLSGGPLKKLASSCLLQIFSPDNDGGGF